MKTEVRTAKDGFTVHLDTYAISDGFDFKVFPHINLAEAALAGALAAHNYRKNPPKRQPPPPKVDLPPGIRLHRRRYVVYSPRYIGTYGTPEEAIAAQAEARQQKDKP